MFNCCPTPTLVTGQCVLAFVSTAAVQAEPPVSIRYWSRSYPGPEESARWTATMARPGNVSFGLSAAMALSFYERAAAEGDAAKDFSVVFRWLAGQKRE